MRTLINKTALIATGFATPIISQAATGNPHGSNLNTTLVGFLSLSFVLLLAVLVMAGIVRRLAFVCRDKIRNEKTKTTGLVASLVVAAMLCSNIATAQSINAGSRIMIAGISLFDFCVLMIVIAAELIVLFGLSFQLRKFINLLRS